MDPSPTGPGLDPRAPADRLRLVPGEGRAIGALAAIYAARMLGLFLLLPVLALYAGGLPGSTPALAGLAMGAYGLTQAFLQIPFGVVSDRLGRRPVILAGLVLYGAGSVLGALATGIGGVIVARMVQGAGAVSGPVTALLADLTRTEIRTRAMALIGISIGGSFVVSIVAAPLLAPLIGVPGIFWVMAALAAVCIVLLYAVVPQPPPIRAQGARDGGVRAALTAELAPYYLGIFVLNFVLNAAFFGVPHALRDVLQIDVHGHWRTYLWVFAASIPPTIPLVLYSERSGRPAAALRLGIGLFLGSVAALAFVYASYWALCLALVAFFASFNFLEARLPARLSQVASPDVRGAALGVFATAQFLGSFAGAQAAGLLFGSSLGLPGVFGGAAAAVLVWLLAIRPERDLRPSE